MTGERVWRAVPLAPARLGLRVRGRGRAVFAARQVYRPSRGHHRWVYGLASAAAALDLAPRATEPGDGLDAVVGHVAGAVGLRVDGVVARRSWVAGRWVVAVASGARLAAVVKVGDGDDTGLRREHEMLVAVARRRLGLAVPPVLWAGEVAGRYVLVTGPLRRRAAPVLDVATAADTATRLTAPPDGGEPLVHGDLTSWNLWRDGDGPVLIDWESAATGRRPLWDLAWFVVTAGALRGAWGPRAAVEALTAPGSPGVVHLRAVGADAASAGRRLREVLEGAGASQRDDRLDRYVTAMRRELARR